MHWPLIFSVTAVKNNLEREFQRFVYNGLKD